jgi:mannonate dehydratase
MMLSFRWYGDADAVPLSHIAQIPGMRGVVSSLYDVPAGTAWTADAVAALRDRVGDAGLVLNVIESIPVHEDIKLGRPERDHAIDAFAQSLEAVGRVGVGVVCYNFMPVFDWMRTDLAMTHPDGATSLSYDHAAGAGMAPLAAATGLPGWMEVYTERELAGLLEAYRGVDAEALWDHLAYFLERVVPAAEAAGVRLALHPDDPPWSIFGLPRIVVDEPALRRVLDLVDHPANGLTFCTGSLGARVENDLPGMVRRLGADGRIHFVHARNVRRTGPRTFHESAHPSEYGDVDMLAVMRALREVEFSGPLRPDHGRMIWGEVGRPGYGLYDRALGATYLLGLWEATRQK